MRRCGCDNIAGRQRYREFHLKNPRARAAGANGGFTQHNFRFPISRIVAHRTGKELQFEGGARLAIQPSPDFGNGPGDGICNDGKVLQPVGTVIRIAGVIGSDAEAPKIDSQSAIHEDPVAANLIMKTPRRTLMPA